MSQPSVVLYRYDASPYSHKIDNVLLLKSIPHKTVTISPVLPRPEITELLGITYRRIPILAIGNDVYCDTNLITSALERRFPASAGYGTIFPLAKHGGGADTGAVKAFSQFYAGGTLFALAPGLMAWDKFPKSFLEDRSKLTGGNINVQAMMAARGSSMSQLSSHLSLIEEQLSDGREWLFDTELPGLADASVHFIFAWISSFRGLESLLDAHKFPNAMKWLKRMSDHLTQRKKHQLAPTKISGQEAARTILSAKHEAYDVVGFDTVEAGRLGVNDGDIVEIAPTDTGRNFPTAGRLVALNREEFVIEVQAPGGLLRCHFPRLGFFVKAVGLKTRL